MKEPDWQRRAERLTESGWSWQLVKLSDRIGRDMHVVEAHNGDGQTHAVVAKMVDPAFAALEGSIKTAIK